MNCPQLLKEVGISSHAAEVTKAAIINNEVDASNKRMGHYTQQQKDDFRRRALELMNTKQPLYRGQWISVEVELPEPFMHYFVTASDGLMHCIELTRRGSDGILQWEFESKAITHWLKLHEIPPLPAQIERLEYTFEEWYRLNRNRQWTFELIADAAWHASRAQLKDNK